MIEPGIYTDFTRLAELRARTRVDPGASLAEVAGQFESLFVSLMLDSMRAATVEGGLFQGPGLELYRDMFDRQLASDVSRTGGIGIADMLVRQLGAQAGPRTERTSSTPAALSAPPPPALPMERETRVGVGRSSAKPDMRAAPVPAVSADERDAAFASAEQFVSRLWPHARAAGRALGQAPEVLLAQAALETGWGRSIIAGGDGSSHNLFGIKAGSGWRGERVRVASLEVVDGVLQVAQADFRAYRSFGESFEDYVSLVSSSPRYAAALAQTNDPAGYLRALQDGGYATDPAYADKILDILERPIMQAPHA